jgi:hypothetical protein
LAREGVDPRGEGARLFGIAPAAHGIAIAFGRTAAPAQGGFSRIFLGCCFKQEEGGGSPPLSVAQPAESRPGDGDVGLEVHQPRHAIGQNSPRQPRRRRAEFAGEFDDRLFGGIERAFEPSARLIAVPSFHGANYTAGFPDGDKDSPFFAQSVDTPTIYEDEQAGISFEARSQLHVLTGAE